MVIDINKTNKKYKIIYADPPWLYFAGGNRNASRHYHCMKAKEIYSLDINKIADDDCILFMWVVFPCLLQGLETIKQWGFEYKTIGFTWVKLNKKSDSLFMGLGNWTRANAELCLIATKGNPKRIDRSVHSVILSRIRKHSQKPDEARRRIVKLIGDLPRIELFARDCVSGWDCWGNEV